MPPPPDEAERLARISAVTDDLDRVLDRLFANAAELKTILARAAESAPGAPGTPAPKEAP